MAFVRSPENISIELLQKGGALPPARTLGVDAEHRQLVGNGRAGSIRRARPGPERALKFRRERGPAGAGS